METLTPPPPESVKPSPRYADFPQDLQRKLDDMKASFENAHGICVAGHVTLSDGSEIQGIKDIQINYEKGASYTCQVSPGGWFVSPQIGTYYRQGGHLALRAFAYTSRILGSLT